MSGELRHRITIEAETKTRDDVGGFTSTWSTFQAVWAKISPASAAEKYLAARVQQVITHKIRIRYLAGLTPAHRIKFNGRVIQIKGIVDPDERKRWLDLACQEGTGS